jgi:hypothetical protein
MTKDSPRTSVLRDAPKRIAMRWEPGAAVTSGLLMSHPDYRNYILAAPEALSEAPEVQALIAEAVERATRVKPLVWENVGRCVGWQVQDENTHMYIACSHGRKYEVAKGRGGWFAEWQGEYHARDLPTLEAAKAAAQADYEQRIRAAIGGEK